MANKKIVVISLGGSLIAPKTGIDTRFLKKFRDLVSKRLGQGERFVIVCGGGVTARLYQEAARKLGHLTSDEIDWLGIHSTRLNAHLVRAMFHGKAQDEVVVDPRRPLKFRKSILLAAGWKPGRSTDHIAVLLAKKLGARMVLNLSDIDYVYTADPDKVKNAQPYKEIGWSEFRKLIGNKWDPGSNAPFDPVASKLAEKIGLTVKIVNGRALKDVEDAIVGRYFHGTIID